MGYHQLHHPLTHFAHSGATSSFDGIFNFWGHVLNWCHFINIWGHVLNWCHFINFWCHFINFWGHVLNWCHFIIFWDHVLNWWHSIYFAATFWIGAILLIFGAILLIFFYYFLGPRLNWPHFVNFGATLFSRIELRVTETPSKACSFAPKNQGSLHEVLKT